MSKYRIAWKSKTHDVGGHGDWMPKEDAEEWAEKANRSLSSVHHWVEAQPTIDDIVKAMATVAAAHELKGGKR